MQRVKLPIWIFIPAWKLDALINSDWIDFNIYIGKDICKNGFLFCSRILNTEPIISDDLSPVVSDFISKLLIKDPRKRLGGGRLDAEAVKGHPFFKVSSLPATCLLSVLVLNCVLSVVTCTKNIKRNVNIHTVWRFSVLFLRDFILLKFQ
jgi:serine/threonine protein kinase